MFRFKVQAGSVTGKDHLLRQSNCQDKFSLAEVEIKGETYLVGVVCDGCGSGRHSEIGAGLLAHFLTQEIARQLTKGIPLEWLPDQLYRAALQYLRRIFKGICPSNPEHARLVLADFLLTTVLGFVMNEREGIIFSAGDGLFVLNKSVTELDQQNEPHYLAYDLLSGKPSSFEVRRFKVENLERLALWTDGITPELLPEMWGHRHPRDLQRKLNVLSKKGRFYDDATGIVLERVA